MKKNILVLVSIVSLFISCSNFVEDSTIDFTDESSTFYTVKGSLVSEDLSGAVPRSAFPSNNVDLNPYTTEIYYKASSTATQRTLCGTTTDNSFVLKIPALGTYYLEAESYLTSDANKTVALKTNEPVKLTLTEDAPYKNTVSLFLKVIVGESDATGSIGLYMKYFDPFIVIHFEITENGIFIHDGDLYDNASVYGKSGVTAGVHNYVFSFYDGIYGNLVYQCYESVTVFPGKTTDTWVTNGNAEYFSTEVIGGKETVVMNITQECLDNFALTNFYVKESGDDSNNGSYFTPFRTLDKALSKCTVAGVNYSINIDGDYTQPDNITVPAGIRLRINGLDTGKTKLIRSSSESSPFITVSNGAVVTINNLGIEGTDTLITYDGTTGIYNEGTLTLNNCTVSKFKSNKYGGIHTKGKLVTKNTEIFGNVANDAENGIAGGVFVESGTFEFRDGYIHDNSAAKEGAGVYVNDSTCTFKMSGSAHLTTDNVVYLNNSSFVTIDGDLTSDTAAKIKLSSCANANSNNLEVLKPENGASVDNYGKFKMDKYSYNDGPYTYTYTLEGNKIKRSKSNRR
ncbi:MAG: hypothetical protein MJ176_05570 [Treponema sp.]|nr:hypothetical protein [Treponema sp.]